MDTPISVESRETHEISSDADVVRVRQLARAVAVSARLSLVDQTKLVTAVSELARNTLVHGGGGTARLELVTEGERRGVRAVFTDSGPGIVDIRLALTDGWTSGTGMGLGLPGTKRLVDGFDVQSSPGAGTTVTVIKWSR